MKRQFGLIMQENEVQSFLEFVKKKNFVISSDNKLNISVSVTLEELKKGRFATYFTTVNEKIHTKPTQGIGQYICRNETKGIEFRLPLENGKEEESDSKSFSLIREIMEKLGDGGIKMYFPNVFESEKYSKEEESLSKNSQLLSEGEKKIQPEKLYAGRLYIEAPHYKYLKNEYEALKKYFKKYKRFDNYFRISEETMNKYKNKEIQIFYMGDEIHPK